MVDTIKQPSSCVKVDSEVQLKLIWNFNSWVSWPTTLAMKYGNVSRVLSLFDWLNTLNLVSFIQNRSNSDLSQLAFTICITYDTQKENSKKTHSHRGRGHEMLWEEEAVNCTWCVNSDKQRWIKNCMILLKNRHHAFMVVMSRLDTKLGFCIHTQLNGDYKGITISKTVQLPIQVILHYCVTWKWFICCPR